MARGRERPGLRDGQVATRVLGLAAGLGDGIEADEAGKQDRGGGQKRRPLELRARARHPHSLAGQQGGGEVAVIEEETGDDDDGPQREHDEHQRHQRALIQFHPTQIHQYEEPQECQRHGQPDTPAVEGLRQTLHLQRCRDIS